MCKFHSVASILLATLLLAGCSGSKKSEFDGIPAQELYNKGQTYLQDGDYNNAIRYLDAVGSNAQQGAYGEQVQLSLIYAQYKLGEYYQALDIAERFARAYPNSASMDYVFYLAALSNVRLGDNWFQDLFNIDDSKRAVENARNAFGNFQSIVQHYPHSQYAEEAQQWMHYLRNRLAKHELNIVKFYMKRDAYVAVVNRIDDMLRYYGDTQATQQALPYLKQAFSAMGIHDSAAKAEALIAEYETKSYPDVSKPAYRKQF